MSPYFVDLYKSYRAHGYTAEAAFYAAKAFINFRKRMNKELATHKKRVRSAKKGWKTRRAALRAAA